MPSMAGRRGSSADRSRTCRSVRSSGRSIEFDTPSTVGSSFSIENLFGEGLHRIGDFAGATSGDTTFLFLKCRFNFRWETNGNGVPPNAADFANCTASVKFDGCTFDGFPNAVPLKGAINLIVDNCEMADCEPATAERIFHNATMGGLVGSSDPRYPIDMRSMTYSQRALSTGAEARTVLLTGARKRPGATTAFPSGCSGGAIAGHQRRSTGSNRIGHCTGTRRPSPSAGRAHRGATGPSPIPGRP